ncbi:MAG: NAD-dependent epimerase/dehydratase family protein [Caldilineaceae bacterium]|nr:NAD-dependent epimerase/dehydratase family protein [Caldilineaceae bacterium]
MSLIKHVLVTGGAGFVGANLVRTLLKRGYTVRVLDNFSSGNRASLAGLDIDIVEGDILDRAAVDAAVAGTDGIVHLAAQTGVPGSIQDPMRDCQLNVVGTLNMLEAARLAGTKRFVFASSNAPLGKQPPPATEDKAPLPISPYGASKLAGEGYCLAYHGSWGLGTVALRFANLYGPFSAHKNSVVAKFIKDIQSTGTITIDGDGLQTRDFIYVGDLCEAVVLALESDIGGEVFQIATGIETSIRALADQIEACMDVDLAVQYGTTRQGDIRKNYSRVDKAREQLGWEPQVALDEGLALTLAWFASSGDKA